MSEEPIYIIDSNNERRYLGNNPSPVRFSWPIYGAGVDNIELVPRSQWKELIGTNIGPEDPYLPPVHDQNGIGMCNASATVAAMESCRLQAGLEHIPLSGGDLYHRISGGVDRGSMLEDGIKESMENGVASVAVVPYLSWRQNYNSAKEDRLRFKVLEAFLCPTFDHCMSAALKGFKIIMGMMWSQNFSPDSDGWLPSRGFGGGGHALFSYKGTYRGDRFGLWTQNSWSSSWGKFGGRLVIGEEHFKTGIGGFWAVRSVTTESTDVPTPKF